ncbi:MAG: hypothetical protein AAGI63_17000, partial [Planctomycetota bacterium]
MPSNNPGTTVLEVVPFPSLTAMRSVDQRLLKRQRETQNSPDFLQEVEAFIECARETGTLLDADKDRDTAQTLIDYWTTALYRATRKERRDLVLKEFDPAAANVELSDDQFPYKFTGAVDSQERSTVGDERLIDESIKRIEGDNSRLAVIVGPAAHGKSDLLQALLSKLKDGATTNSASWCYLPIFVPGPQLLESLGRLFEPRDVDTVAWTKQQCEEFESDDGHLAKLIATSASDTPAVFVVDRFEQVFISCSCHERDVFAKNLVWLIENTEHTIVLVSDSDFLGRFDRLGPLRDHVQNGLVYVAFTTGEFRRAIEQPAKLIGLKFDDGLVDRLILDVQGDPAALSLLQFTLRQLWDHREGNRITWEQYNRIGGGRLALERAAESAYKRLSEADQRHVREIACCLVKPAVGKHATICDAKKDEFYRRVGDHDAVDRIINGFTMAGLLAVNNDSGAPVVTVKHEALVGHWPRLMDWIAEERDSQRRRMRLTEASQAWDSRNRDAGVLWRGSQLDDAESHSDLSKLEGEFVRASRDAVKKAEDEKVAMAKRERDRALFFLAGLTVAFVMVAVMAAVAYAQRNKANEQRNEANANAELAKTNADIAISKSNIAQRKELNLTIARGTEFQESGDHPGAALWFNQALKLMQPEGKESRFTPQERKGLERRVATSLRQQPVLSQVWAGNAASFASDGASVIVAFNDPDGRSNSKASSVSGIRVHSSHDGRETTPRYENDGEQVGSVAVSSDNKWIATSGESSVHIWDAATGKRNCTLFDDPSKRVRQIVFSNDGKKFAIAIGDVRDHYGQIQVWRSSDDGSGPDFEPQMISRDLKGRVAKITFSKDGAMVAAAIRAQIQSRPNAARARDIRIQDRPDAYQQIHGDWRTEARGVARSTENGHRAAIWDLQACEESEDNRPSQILEHRLIVNDIKFNPGCARQDDAVAEDAHSETAYHLVTASGSHSDKVGEIQFWSVSKFETDRPPTPGRAITHRDGVKCVAYSPDGKILLVGDYGGTALLKDAFGERLLGTLQHGSTVNNAVFSPDGRYVATGSRDRTVRLWDVATGKLALRPLWHTAGVGQMEFGKHGRNLLTITSNAVRLWRLHDQNPPTGLLSIAGEVQRIGSSRRGDSLVVMSKRFDDEMGTCSILTAISGKPQLYTLRPMSSAEDNVAENEVGHITHAAVSDRGRAATADHLGFIRCWQHQGNEWKEIWKSESGHSQGERQAGPISKPAADEVKHVAISPDGNRIAIVRFNSQTQQSFLQAWSIKDDSEIYSRLIRNPRKSSIRLGNETERYHDEGILSISFSKDAKQIATTGQDDKVFVWPLSNALTEPLGPFQHTADAIHADFDGTGEHLVTSGMDQNVLLWNLKEARSNTKHKPEVVLRHVSFVSHTQFSPDSTRLVTACNDGRARVWRIPLLDNAKSNSKDGSCQLVSVLEHRGSLERVAFLDEGMRIATVGFYVPVMLERRDDEITRSRRRLSVRTWDISETIPDAPTATHVASARSYDEKLNEIEFLSADDFQQKWNESMPNQPSGLSEKRESLADWHQRIAGHCELTCQWFAAEWHLSHLIDRNPGNADLLRRRSTARAELRNYDDAAEDAGRAIQLGASENEVRRTRALALLRSSQTEREIDTIFRDLCKKMLAHHRSVIVNSGSKEVTSDQLMQANLGVWTCVTTPR